MKNNFKIKNLIIDCKLKIENWNFPTERRIA